RDGQARADQRDARHVAALRAVGLGAAHDHVLDLGDVELRGLAEDVLDAVGGQVIRTGDVERPAMGLGERGGGGGDDDSLSHGGSFLRGKAGGSIPQRCAEGTQAVVRPPTVSWRMCSPRTVVAGGPPRRWPQRRWKSHQRGYRSLSEPDRTARPITDRIFASNRRPSAAESVLARRLGAMPAW